MPVKPSVFNVRVAPDGSEFEALYNSATGNYLVLNEDLGGLYRRVCDGTVPREEAASLFRTGFVVDDCVDEVAAVGRAFAISRVKRFAPLLTIAPTMDCNFGCAYCFESHTRGVMPEAMQDHLVAFARSLCERIGGAPPLAVTWFGGEPLMGLPAIERLSGTFLAMRDAGEVQGYTANIITNGYGLTPKTCEVLARCEISQIQITLDGPARIHDGRRFLKRSRGQTFQRIVDNIANVPETMAIVVRMNVDRDNKESFAELFEELDAAGVLDRVSVDLAQIEHFSRHPAAPSLLSSREFAAFKLSAIDACQARGWPLLGDTPLPSITGVCQVDSANSFVVSAEGALYKCPVELGNNGHCVGRVDDPDSWHRIAKTPLTERDPLDDAECRSCALLPTCMGSCPLVRDLNRKFHGKQCPPYKYNFAELIYRQFGSSDHIRKQLYTE